jgi:hypothetical protein
MFEHLTGLETFYAFCALAGGSLFLVRLVLQFFGGDLGGSDDALDLAAHGAHMGDSDISFKLLSLQGLTAFFMMFGLVGLALSKQSGFAEPVSVTGGILAGLFTAWVIQKVFVMMKGLQSSGNINLENAVGVEGTVYLGIPPSGTGKVEIMIQNRLRVMDAITEQAEELKTGERIKVVRIHNGNTLVVEKAAVPTLEAAATEKVS